MQYTQAIESFITYLRVHRNASPKTVEQYELHLWKFLDFVDPKTTRSLDLTLTHQEIFLGTTPLRTKNTEDIELRPQKTALKMFLRSQCRIDTEHISIDDLNEFRFFLTEKGLSIKSANAYMITFRTFYKFLKKK